MSKASDRQMLSGAVLSMLDQALLSAVNFAIGLAFMRLTDKVDYGLYTQFFTLLLLSQVAQNALANAPMVSLAPRRRARGMQALAAILFRMQTVASFGVAAVAVAGVYFSVDIGLFPQLPVELAWPFAAAIIGQWGREFARKYSYIRLEPMRALLTDALFAGLLFGGLLLGIWLQRFGTGWVLGCMGAANLIAALVELHHARLRPLRAHGRAREPLRAAWQKARWSLPAVLVGWGSNYSFVYVVAAVVGVAATAEISAARLLMMPAGICIIAWGNSFAPRITRWLHRFEFQEVRRIIALSIVGLAAIIITYTSLLWLVFDLLVAYVIGPDYASVLNLSVLWALYFCVNAWRKVGATCLAGDGRFRELFHYSWIVFGTSLPLTILLTWKLGTAGAVIGMIAAELIDLSLTWGHGWRKLRRSQLAHRAS